MSEVTQILDQIQQGNRSAASELLPLVYAELRRLAVHRMSKEKPGQTLQPTASFSFFRCSGRSNAQDPD